MTMRLAKELRQCHRGVSAEVDYIVRAEEDGTWSAWLQGSPDSPYEGGVWRLVIAFPACWPMRPPDVKFLTPVYHANIHCATGQICVDLLDSEWSPALTVDRVLVALQSLLADPISDSRCWGDAQMHEILRLCRDDRSAYNRTAREWTQRHASDTLLTSFESQSEKGRCRTRCLMWVAAQVELLHELPPGSLCDVWRTHVAARASAGFFPCSA